MTPRPPAATPAYTTQARPATDPCVPCAVCGGLECLCRPRFFAGQLLTEADLNRLDRYIVEKNKLHNRYVHGWGVACGLEVTCHPCGNLVLVRPGYALSRCGDDIIVCTEETVDVCKLITDCCSPPVDECQPPRPRPPGCEDLEQRWVLAICYRETPSRGVTALKGSAQAPCCSKCGGNGSSSCGCGCGEKTRRNGTGSSAKRTPPQCEPTVLCEGYYFKVYPAPREDDRTPSTSTGVPTQPAASRLGAMLDRYLNCVLDLVNALPPPPAANATLDQIHQWCCDVRDILLTRLAQNPGTDCGLMEQLRAACPTPIPGTAPQQYLNQVVLVLFRILVEIFRHCLCSALLPPCPEPVTDPCVPLATITVRRNDCRILRVCNLDNRKFLTTFPNLQYWLSWLPYVRLIRDLLERLCCRPLVIDNVDVRPGRSNLAASNARRTKAAAPQTTNLTTTLMDAFSRRGARRTLTGMPLDALGFADANGQAFLSQVQADNPLSALVADEILSPVLGNALPAGAGAIFAGLGGVDAVRLSEENQRRDRELQSMRAQIDQLQTTIRTQQVVIDGLVSRIPRTE